MLHVATEKLDHVCFRSLAARARQVMSEVRFDDGAELFRSALAQWRGPALADVDTTPALGRYALGLEEERLRCLEHRLGAELYRGLHFDVVDELEELAARCPFREVFHVQLMLALHRCGRRADALRAYQSVHRAMADQLGITPGPALRAVQRAILEGREPRVRPHG